MFFNRQKKLKILRYTVIREKFERIVVENDLSEEVVVIRAKPLTPEEAMGNPESEDFPILKGVERLMQEEFSGCFGQAFTNMYGDFEGTLQDVLAMELNNNYRRAIFVATLNAVLRSIGMIEGSVHCKDKGPAECGLDLLEFLEGYGGRGSHWLDFSRFMHGAVLNDVNSECWIWTRRTSERRSSVLWCWMVVRRWKRCCGGAIWRLLRGRRLLTGPLRRYWRLRG